MMSQPWRQTRGEGVRISPAVLALTVQLGNRGRYGTDMVSTSHIEHVQLSANRTPSTNVGYTERMESKQMVYRHAPGNVVTAGTVGPDKAANFDQMDDNCRACTSDLVAS